MTHNPAAAHPRLLALIEGMEKIEQAATPGPWDADAEMKAMGFEVDGGFVRTDAFVVTDADWQFIALSRNALPPLLAFLRAEAEYHVERYDFYIAPYASQIMAVHRDAHARICTTALAAAAGTPALALLAGELQGAMDGNA